MRKLRTITHVYVGIALIAAAVLCGGVSSSSSSSRPPVEGGTTQSPSVTMASSVSQHGITWYFDKNYPVGQFINGDWWVVGPVTIIDVNPRPSGVPPNEANDLGANHWGDTALRDNKDRRNGSMVLMKTGTAQGYDSRGIGYQSYASITFPYTLAASRSLISSISTVVMPGMVMEHELFPAVGIGTTGEILSKQAMKTAAVLTSLDSVPPEDAFRPTYAGGVKEIYRYSQLRMDRLLKLPAPSNTPSFAQFARYFERPWIDHLNGSWQGQWLVPIENQPDYGREYVRIVSIASLMLHLNFSEAQKRKLLIGFIQYGIDLRGIAGIGGHWNSGGGLTSGRKWPILFAGLMLNDSTFAAMPSTAIFHEDTQTYYGQGWAGQKALWQMVFHHGPRLPYMHIHPSLWSKYDAGWAKTSELYRTCCTIMGWPGQALAALLMGAKGTWNHDAFFDNVEDWMRKTDVYAANRDGYRRSWRETRSFDPFVDAMWSAYRSSVPSQPNGTTNLMWDPLKKIWANNPKP